MEINLTCNGVADNWLVAAGAAGWPVALASLFLPGVAGKYNFGWNTLSTVPAVVMVKSPFFYAKTASGVPAWAELGLCITSHN
ncbi:hypothetical protein ACNKHU_17105 [Shigella flexneri]